MKQEGVRNQLLQEAKSCESVAKEALQEANKQGANEAKVVCSAAVVKRLSVEAGEFTLANQLQRRGLGLVVHKDQRKGSSTTNVVTPSTVKQAVRNAVAMAEYSIPDENLNFLKAEHADSAPVLEFLFEDQLAEMDLSELIGPIKEVLAYLKQDSRVAIDRLEMDISSGWSGLYNSYGVEQSELQNRASWMILGMARDGEAVSGLEAQGGSTYSKVQLLPCAFDDAKSLSKRVIDALKPVRCPSYKGAILLTPRGVSQLFLNMVLYHMSGRAVMDGKSKWENSTGQRVLSDSFSLIDSPHDSLLSGSTGFDSDGMPTRKQTLIEKGVLNLHLQDSYTAKKLGKKLTATAGGPFCLEILPGQKKLASLVDEHKNLLVVDRFSGNTDPVKGDFSGVVKGSRYWQNGQDCGVVTETMISGNFFDIINSQINLSSEVETVGYSYRSPYILLDTVSVTGN